MRKIKSTLATAVLAAAIGGGTYAFFASPFVPMAHAHMRDHPKLAEADKSLKEAMEYLQTSPSDFHGHKAEAIHAIQEARERISLCVEDEERKASVDAAPLEEHPKLREAREHIKEGRRYLDEAKADFHGHKGEAIKWMDEAVHQINLCLGEEK